MMHKNNYVDAYFRILYWVKANHQHCNSMHRRDAHARAKKSESRDDSELRFRRNHDHDDNAKQQSKSIHHDDDVEQQSPPIIQYWLKSEVI